MGEVVQLEREYPHLSGEAICTNCGHEWQAVVPVGVTMHLECPECHTHQGLLNYGIEPPTEKVWECQCGEQLFFVTPEGLYCRRCGALANFDSCIGN